MAKADSRKKNVLKIMELTISLYRHMTNFCSKIKCLLSDLLYITDL